MAGEFKIGSGYIEVRLRDQTGSDITRIRQRLRGLDHNVRVGLDDQTGSGISRLQQRLRGLDTRATVTVREQGVSRASGALDGLSGSAMRAVGGLSGVGGAAGAAGSGMLRAVGPIGALVSVLGGIPLAAGAAGAALAALPGIAGSLAGIGGVLFGAFNGVGDALKGYQQDQEAAATATRSTGNAAAAAARQIRDAKQAVEEARIREARVARDSAERITDAERDVARAARDSREAIEDAERAVRRAAEETAEAVQDAKRDQARVARSGSEQLAQAGRRVADALRDEQRAQEGLARARQDAIRDVQELQERVDDYTISEESASIAVARAQERLDRVRKDKGASVLDLREAENDYAAALERQRDLAHQRYVDEQQLAKVQKEGVDSTEEVRSAQERAAAASQSVKDAQSAQAQTARDVSEANTAAAQRVAEAVEDGALRQSDAERNLAEIRRESQERQADAARALAEAQRDAQEQQADAARATRDALESLADAQAQAAERIDAAAAPVSKFGQAMAKLTPEGRAFVNQLLRMKPLLQELRDEAQRSFLPGLTQMLRDSEGLFPIFKEHIRDTGTIMGDAARKMGELFKTDQFKSNLDKLFDSTEPITRSLGDMMVKLTDRFVQFGAEMTPASEGFATFLDGVTEGLVGFFDALAPHADTFKRIWVTLGELMKQWLPIIGEIIGWLAEEFLMFLLKVQWVTNAVKVAWRAVGDFFSWVGTNVIKPAWNAVAAAALWLWNNVLSPTWNAMKVAFQAVGAFFSWVWTSIIKPTWDALGAGIRWVYDNILVPVWNAMKAGLQAVGDFFRWVWNSVIKPAWEALGAGVRWVYQNILVPTWNGMRAGLQAIGDFFRWIWNSVIRPAWDALGAGIKWVWENVIRPAWEALKTGLRLIGDAFTNTVNWVRTKWAEIREAARAPVQWVVDVVYNNGIRPVWNGIASLFGMSQLGPVHLARGGIVPGHDYGYDTVPAMLRGGEGVLVPEAVRAIGGAAGINRLNRMAEAQHFAEGGVVGGTSSVGANGTGTGLGGSGGFLTDLFTKGPADAVRGLFSKVVGDANRTPGAGSWRDALVKLPGKLIDAVIGKAKSMASSLAGGMFGSSRSTPNGVGGLGPMAAAARQFVMATWGIRNIGGYARRNIAGTSKLSDHALGKAIDVMIPNYRSPASIGLGNNIAQWFVANPGRFGTKYVIWRDQINSGRGWRPYGHPGGGRSDTMQHRDHVHVSFFDKGGVAAGRGMIPKGTLRPERVLSPDQTVAFERLVAVLERQGTARTGMGSVHVHMTQPPGSPMEAARLTALALRSVG